MNGFSFAGDVLHHSLPADGVVCLSHNGLHLAMNVGENMAQARGAVFSFTQNIIAELMVGTGKLIVLYCVVVTCVLALLVEHLGSEDFL